MCLHYIIPPRRPAVSGRGSEVTKAHSCDREIGLRKEEEKKNANKNGSLRSGAAAARK